MPSYSVSEHATRPPHILRLTKAAVSEPSPHSNPQSQCFLSLETLFCPRSPEMGRKRLVAGVGEGEVLEPGPQSWLGECMGGPRC